MKVSTPIHIKAGELCGSVDVVEFREEEAEN